MLFAMSRRPSRRLTAGVAAAVTAGFAIAAVLPSSAFAAKTSTASQANQAQQKADALGVAADRAVEAYDAAQVKLTVASAQLKAQQAAVAKAKTQLDDARVGIRALAAAEYEGSSLNTSVSYLLSDDPEALLRKAAMLSQVNRAQTANLTRVINADRQVEAAQTSAEQALAAQKAAAAKVAASKAAVEKALKAQQAVLTSLQSQLQQQAAAAAAQRTAAVQHQAASRSTVRSNVVPRAQAPVSGGTTSHANPPAASGNAAAALAYAYAQLGKPYRFGGAGPNSFDCSGLTMRAWGAAGVSLSHSAAAQQHEGKRVSLSALQPGDLVFWGSPAYHVGIYVGGGRVLDAPHTGTVVKIQSIWGHPSGAVRP